MASAAAASRPTAMLAAGEGSAGTDHPSSATAETTLGMSAAPVQGSAQPPAAHAGPAAAVIMQPPGVTSSTAIAAEEDDYDAD